MADPGPLYLLAGGPGARRGGRDELLAAAVRDTGVPRPRVAYVGAPSDDNRVFFLLLSRMLRAAGAARVDHVRLAGRRPDLSAARALVEAADLVFITGGDVERGIEIIDTTGFRSVLDARRATGVPFVGVSAGSITLARRWIRWSDPNDEATASLFDCLGYASLCCDTHGEGDGWEELQALLALTPVGTVGYGIATGCALRLTTPGGDPQALGGPVHRYRRDAGGVTRIDDLPAITYAG